MSVKQNNVAKYLTQPCLVYLNMGVPQVKSEHSSTIYPSEGNRTNLLFMTTSGQM